MIALLQRVRRAAVRVDEQLIGEIGPGLLVFVGMEQSDTSAQLEPLVSRILDYRVFEDEQGRMNRSLRDIEGGLLLVPQFTLAADTRKGLRPSFTPALAPTQAEPLFHALVDSARKSHPHVAAGQFGADMQVELINDGPVTFWLQTPSAEKHA
jgi:D-tyrosyl-tRNA(Tyr) deacylase